MKSDPREKPATFELRVNGMVVSASMRRAPDDSEECDVVIHDPLVGDTCICPGRQGQTKSQLQVSKYCPPTSQAGISDFAFHLRASASICG